MQSLQNDSQDFSRWVQSHATCRAILKKNPEHVPALFFMGKYEYKCGHPDMALQYLGKAYALSPSSVDICTTYAMVLLVQKKIPESLVVLRQLASIKTDCPDVLYLLANTLKDFGHATRCQEYFVEAIEHYTHLLRLKQLHAGAHNNLGVTYLELCRLAEAQECFMHAATLAPQLPEPLNNLSTTLRLQGLPDQSVACCRNALTLRPDYPEAFNNLGNALKDLDDLQGARAAYEQAIALRPDPDVQCNLALVLLTLGLFKEGWETYEWRKQSYELQCAQPHLAQPMWRGQEAAGKTLLIHGEQGFGDIIQFCRYASMVADKGLRVVLEAPPALVRLMQTLRGVDQIIPTGQPLPAFDFHCPMLSLPLAFGTELDTIPATSSYLSAATEDILAWQQRMTVEKITGFKVGLVWAGNSRKHSADLTFTDQKRSMAAEYFAPLMAIQGVRYFNLQKNGPAAPGSLAMLNWIDACNDFADTAALIMNLDLVITVDTSVAHLAGALGKPVWVVNRFAGCWRWLRGRDDSPWYPSLRLFTQETPGDWPSVIARVQQRLQAAAQSDG